MIALRHEGTTDALLLTFHGTGGDERQFHALGQRLMPGAHVVSPRGEVSEGGSLRYFRRLAEGVYDMEDLTARTDAMAEFVAGEAVRTGAARVAGLGYSNGANILAAVLLARPDLLADAVLLHPLIPLRASAAAGARGPAGPRHRRAARPDLPARPHLGPRGPPGSAGRGGDAPLARGRARGRALRVAGGRSVPSVRTATP